MADAENDEQLTQDVKFWFQQANKELGRFGMVTSATAAKLKKALGANVAALEKNTDEEEKENNRKKKRNAAMAKAVAGVGSFANGIRKNRDSFESLNPAIKATGALMGKAGQAIGAGIDNLGNAVDNIGALNSKVGKYAGLAGKAISALGKGIGGASEAASQLAVSFGEFATGELQQVLDSFRKVGSVGAIGAKGVTGMYQQAIDAGMSLSQFSELIQQNGQSFALAYGDTASAAKAFSQIGKESVGWREDFVKLGVTVADQRKYQAGFIERNQMIGITDARDKKAMAAASRDYLLELDTLSRITGKSKDELAKKLEDDMKNVRVASTKSEIEAQYGNKGLETMETFWEGVAKVSPEMSQGLKESFFNTASEAGQKVMAATGINPAEFQQRLAAERDPAKKDAMLQDFFRTVQAAGKRQSAAATGLGNAMDMSKAASLKIGQTSIDNMTWFQDAKKSQQDALNTTDENTKRTVDANIAMNDMAVQVDQMVKDNVLPTAAKTVKSFTQSMEETIKLMSEAIDYKAGGEGTNGGTYSADDAYSGAVGAGTGSYGAASAVPATPATAGSTQQVMEAIKSKESGGNYQAQNPRSSASGAYQFIDSTWQSLTKKHGIGQEFARAKDAPKEIQDLIAQKHVEELTKKAGGDISKVPVAWLTGNIQGKMGPGGAAINPSVQAYQADVMNRYNKIGAQNPGTMPVGRPGSPSWNAANAGQEVTAANGGTFSGPRSGYAATLHGTEAVVPLPNGRSIPVEGADASGANGQQMQMMAAQTSKLEQLARILERTTNLSDKMLRATV